MPSASNPFVAGRTYSPYIMKTNEQFPTAECLFADYKTVVLRWTNGTVLTGSPEKFFSEGWKEVVEPHFVVGHKYVRRYTNVSYECLWFNNTHVVMGYDRGKVVMESTINGKHLFLKASVKGK